MRVVSVLYRALGPDGRLICESDSARALLDTVTYVDVPVTFERKVILEYDDGWQAWDPEKKEENVTAN